MQSSSTQIQARRAALRSAVASVVVLAASSWTSAQALYTWANTGADWTSSANWLPTGGPPSVTGVAQFVPPSNGTVFQPNLNAATTVRQLVFGGATAGGWSISGSGALTTGINGGFDPSPPNTPLGVTGLFTWAGSGDHTINLGNGSSTSLTMGGLAVSSAGAMILSANSRLILTGNTVATIDNSLINNATSVPQMAIRSGTLVLDNSGGNPLGERLTTGSSNFNMVGGGSAIELRGAASGSVFGGVTRGVLLSAGSCYLRTVQSGSGTLAASFSNISRATARHQLFVENIGTGFAGDVGRASITSAAAPSNFNVTQSFGGVISGSTTSAIPWVMVTNRASDSPAATVTGRWADYSGRIIASSPTLYTGDFAAAPASSNVLSAPSSTGTIALSGSPAGISSIVFEPTISGATLDLGANSLNTRGVALSGANDMTVANGNLFYNDASGGGRTINVLNPTTSLFVSSNLADPANSSLLVGGQGFLVLNGSSNQVAYPGAQTVFLNDGVLRVTTSNFVPTNTAIAFRGGTLEYDVSAGSASINFGVASGSGNVTWSSTSPGSAGEFQTTDVGGGGFSAYSATPGNSLTINLGGAGAQLDWNAPGFITTYHALKFGSLKSNATVDFQNPIGLGTATGLAYRTRNIHVTRGAGNAADKTRLSGVISGIAGYDLVKTGSGVLETTAANTYNGNTIVREGELRILATNTGSGAYRVESGTLVFAANQNLSAIAVGDGARARLSADGNRRLVTTNLEIAGQSNPTGQFDLTNNAVVVDYTSFSPLATLAAQVRSGRAGGAWTGNGVISSTAASASSTGVGFAEAGDVFSSFPAMFAGVSVDSTSVLMRYTLLGDADLDQSVNIGDFSSLAVNFNTPGMWSRGDFDYDGVVGIGDFAFLAANFNRSVARSAVPEPGLAVVSLLSAARFRRQRRSGSITSG